MKKVTLSLDSSLKEIFTYEESRAVFDKFLPGMRTMAEKQPAALGFSVRKIIQFSGGAIPDEAADALDAALCALELYSAEPEMSDTPLTPDGAEVVPEPPRDAIYPGKVWRDTNGRRIQAHGGALYYDDGVYYWYGENKDHTDGKCPVWTWGMRAYRSTGADACFTVLQADKFLGPYEIVKAHYRPFGCEVGDFDIAVCGDTAYLYMDANHNGQLTMRLTRDFLEAEEKICWQYEGLHAPFSREAPAVFEHGGKWYMLTSGMTGYVPNKSDSAVSDAPDRPFVSIGDPHADDASHASFNSQISQVFKVPGKRDLYIALADRWVPDYPVDAKLADLLERCTAQRFDPEHYKATSEEMQTMMQSPMLTSANTSRANYVWLPITFEEGKPKIYWRDSWKLSDFK